MTSIRIVCLGALTAVLVSLAGVAPAAAATDLAVGGQGQVANTNGDGVRLRERPSTDSTVLKVLGEGWRVTVIAGPLTGASGVVWYTISHADTTGYILAEYLKAASVDVGETAQVTTDDGAPLRLRDSPGGTVLLTMPHGAHVPVLAGPATDDDGQTWFRVRYEGQEGWALGAYLRPAGPAARQRETTSRASGRPTEPSAPANGRRATIAAIARQYIGSPYAYGGSSPAGFDCSGFTRFVVAKATGIQLGRDTEAQVTAGVAIDPGELRPGDLVFHRNTYRPGLSHVGIYIGNGQMVSAQSEQVGVQVTSIWDGYWGPRFHSARRIA